MTHEKPSFNARNSVREAAVATLNQRFEANRTLYYTEEQFSSWSENIENYAVTLFEQTQHLLEIEQRSLSAINRLTDIEDWISASAAANVANSSLKRRIGVVMELRKLGADPIHNEFKSNYEIKGPDQALFFTWANTNFPSLLIPGEPNDSEMGGDSDTAFWRGYLYGSER